jgi:HAMP domain-containing protein
LTPAERRRAAAERKAAREAARKERAILRRAEAERRRFRSSQVDAYCAAGGFAGLAMFVLCMILLILPALTVEGSFRTVRAVDARFDSIREYVTALLMGDDPMLDVLSYQNDPGSVREKSTDPVPLYFTGKQLIRVESNSRNNVYLRGWVATDYDDATGNWSVPVDGSDLFSDYRSLFGTAVDPSETMMYLFYSLSDPESIPDDLTFDYSSRSKSNTVYGFTVTQVNMRRIELDSRLLYMPSYGIRAFNVNGETASKKQALYLRAYGEETASKITYANYFDGLFSTFRGRKDRDGYAVVAMVPNQKTSSWIGNVSAMIADIYEARRAVKATGSTPHYYSPNDPAIMEYSREAYFRGRGLYVIQSGLGDTFTYSIEHRDSDGRVIPEDQLSVTKTDGYIYIVTDYYSGNHRVGDAVYRFSEDGTLRYKTVENIDASMAFDSEGNEIIYGAPSLPMAVRYYEFMTDAQRGQFDYYWRVSDFYSDFVYKAYTAKSSSAVVSELAHKIADSATERVYRTALETDPDTGEVYEVYYPEEVPMDFSHAADRANSFSVSRNTYLQRHRLVMALVNYLADEDNFTYTLTPSASGDEALIGVEKFLSGSREGYCVQYATALVLMLRELGIPARYVDGFIAADFTPTYGRDSVANYATTVRDRHGHAWVEVWFDGVGWVQYEATPAYYDGMYETQGGGSEIRPTPPPVDPGDDEPDEPEGLTDEELAELIRRQQEEARRARIRKIVTVAAVVTAVAALIAVCLVLQWIRAERAQKERDALAAKFASADPSDPASVPTREEVRRFSDLIMLMLSVCGLAPQTGEFRDEYAVRLAAAHPGALAKETPEEKLSELAARSSAMDADAVRTVLGAIAAEEFGYGAAPADMPLMARFWRRMYAYCYRREVGMLRRSFLWFVRRKL